MPEEKWIDKAKKKYLLENEWRTKHRWKPGRPEEWKSERGERYTERDIGEKWAT